MWAQYDKAAPELRPWLRQGQPNCFLPLDRTGVDPFTQRFPVTLRCEGTVRGVGGIKLMGDDCSTGVPGLYAAGDAASRERMTGAITGGGGPNSSWAIASGNWAGRAAAKFAARNGARIADRRVTALGRAGLRPAGTARASSTRDDILQRRARGVSAAGAQFLSPGRDAAAVAGPARSRAGPNCATTCRARGSARSRSREAAALTATSRWAYRSALARAESRGMQRRLDVPAADPAFVCSFEVCGLDDVPGRSAPDVPGWHCAMIEIVSARRCIACDICVKVCPANVFDAMPDAPPVIARQADCQTCFLCEIYCPTDALYVAPGAEGPAGGH